MSISLLRYDNLGSFEEIVFFLDKVLIDGKQKKTSDVKNFCIDHSREFAYSFEGLTELLRFLSIIEITDSKVRSELNESEIKKITSSKIEFCKSTVLPLFKKLSEYDILNDFLDNKKIEYDANNDSIVIKNNLVPLKFSGLKNFLLNISFFEPHRDSLNLLFINPIFQELFENEIIPLLNKIDYEELKSEKKLTVEDLKNIQQILESLGYEAEQFVLEYEKNRLRNHPKREKIKLISGIDTNAGYDIVSFNSLESNDIDRFIEVKSYSGEIGFYWSSNEVKVAKRKRKKYYLYLVNRYSMRKKDYEPLMIQDPYSEIFSKNTWNITAQNWYIKK